MWRREHHPLMAIGLQGKGSASMPHLRLDILDIAVFHQPLGDREHCSAQLRSMWRTHAYTHLIAPPLLAEYLKTEASAHPRSGHTCSAERVVPIECWLGLG